MFGACSFVFVAFVPPCRFSFIICRFVFGIWCLVPIGLSLVFVVLYCSLMPAYRCLLFGVCQALYEIAPRALSSNLPIQAPFLATEIVLWSAQLAALRVHSLPYVFPSEPHTGSTTPTQRPGQTHFGFPISTSHFAWWAHCVVEQGSMVVVVGVFGTTKLNEGLLLWFVQFE